MSLYTLHRLVIVVAILFCAGFALRALVLALSSGSGRIGSAALALAFALVTGGLIRYLRWLVREKSRALARPKRPDHLDERA